MTQSLTTPQPEYRALLMLPTLPTHCTAIMCRDDRSMPHILAGEWAVVDPSDRTPIHGELFGIRFGDKPHQTHICMVRRRRKCGWVDQSYGPDGWSVGAVVCDEVRRVMDRAKAQGLTGEAYNRVVIEANTRTGAWTEGPYQDGGPSYDHLRNCLIGRVIGIYAPTFEGPMREVNP